VRTGGLREVDETLDLDGDGGGGAEILGGEPARFALFL
jgi:hypothetical protein